MACKNHCKSIASASNKNFKINAFQNQLLICITFLKNWCRLLSNDTGGAVGVWDRLVPNFQNPIYSPAQFLILVTDLLIWIIFRNDELHSFFSVMMSLCARITQWEDYSNMTLISAFVIISRKCTIIQTVYLEKWIREIWGNVRTSRQLYFWLFVSS